MAGHSAFVLQKLRTEAITLFREGVAAANPESAVAAALEERRPALAQASRIIVVAFGKAACPMVRAALPFVRQKLVAALALTSRENIQDVEGVEVIAGGLPIPDEGGIKGANAIESAVAGAREGDLVVVLVSGGGSALLCAPPAGVKLADKIALNDALIRSGADISEINAVRPLFSRLKGGRLAQLARPARVLSLILSDVPGDDVATIASGPTAEPRSSAKRALDILSKYGLVGQLPASLERHLENMVFPACQGQVCFGHVENVVVGSNAISVKTVMSKAGINFPQVVQAREWLAGDVMDAASGLHRVALRAAERKGPVAIVAGGETTVKVTGSGKGGRNQQLALSFALLNEEQPIKRPWVFLSGGTDGRDGPTDAAGGIVDAGSPDWMRQQGRDPFDCLNNHDAYHALACSGDLLITGATGTNVADLQIALMV